VRQQVGDRHAPVRSRRSYSSYQKLEMTALIDGMFQLGILGRPMA
jgi:hypothetical protein